MVSQKLVQAMLSKAVTQEVTVAYNKQVAYQEKSGTTTFYNSVSVPFQGDFTITARMVNTGSYTYMRGSVTGGGTQLGDYDLYQEKDKTVTLTFTGNGSASIRYYNNASGGSGLPGTTYLTLVCNNFKLYRNADNVVKLLPRELLDVGNKATTTLFGNHTDGVFFNDLPNEVKMDGDYYDPTGSDITNFKGYITVKIGSYKYSIPLRGRTDA